MDRTNNEKYILSWYISQYLMFAIQSAEGEKLCLEPVKQGWHAYSCSKAANEFYQWKAFN